MTDDKSLLRRFDELVAEIRAHLVHATQMEKDAHHLDSVIRKPIPPPSASSRKSKAPVDTIRTRFAALRETIMAELEKAPAGLSIGWLVTLTRTPKHSVFRALEVLREENRARLVGSGRAAYWHSTSAQSRASKRGATASTSRTRRVPARKPQRRRHPERAANQLARSAT